MNIKWIKQNWFKLSILTLLLICIILLSFYVVSQQKMRKANEISDLQTSCQKTALQKKEELSNQNSDLYLNTYIYKYNPEYKSCLIAYTGFYLGTSLVAKFSGHNLFAIDNLSTGESLFRSQVNPGDGYKEVNESFNNLKNKYLGFSSIE